MKPSRYPYSVLDGGQPGALVLLHPLPVRSGGRAGGAGRPTAPWWSPGTDKDGSSDSVNGDMLLKCAPSQCTKMEKEKKSLLGCNLFLGNVFLKGIYMPWKQIPEAWFQLISAKLATANEHGNCR